jgi:FkbM family methyltransferase
MEFRKIIRKLKAKARIPLSNRELSERYIETQINVIQKYIYKSDFIKIFLLDGGQIIVRPYPSSDLLVLKQVLQDQEYFSIVNFYKINYPEKNLKIIDGGANIGLTSYYFASNFKDCEIIVVEPDESNFNLMLKNLKNVDKNNFYFLKNALMNKSGLSILIKDNFRDCKDWAKATEVTEKLTDLKSISINEIILTYSWDRIDLLKIDIEGAERFLFNKESETTFLNITNAIIIEIHDEFNCRELIYKKLLENNFILFNFGESTIGIKNCKFI